VQGGGLFVLKEKLKNLKSDLKIWNRDIFENVNQVGKDLQKKIQELNARDYESDLDEPGREVRRLLLAKQSGKFFKQEVVLQ